MAEEDKPKGTDHTLGKALRLYAEHEGARDSIRILLDPDARHLLIERMKPRLFVSHLHMDEPLAAALVNVIEATFEVTRPDIRATSVRPYRLTVERDRMTACAMRLRRRRR